MRPSEDEVNSGPKGWKGARGKNIPGTKGNKRASEGWWIIPFDWSLQCLSEKRKKSG